MISGTADINKLSLYMGGQKALLKGGGETSDSQGRKLFKLSTILCICVDSQIIFYSGAYPTMHHEC